MPNVEGVTPLEPSPLPIAAYVRSAENVAGCWPVFGEALLGTYPADHVIDG